MNLQQLRAKYGNGTTTAKEATVETTNKVWSATKTAATKTGGFVKDISPATNRRVNNIAAELNAQLNNHEFELFKHQVMIDMIAQSTGVNLPDDETLLAYFEDVKKQEAEDAKEEATTQVQDTLEETVESMAGKVMEHILSAFKKEKLVPEKESTPAPKKQKKEKKINKESVPADDEVKCETSLEAYSVEAMEERAKEEALAKKLEDKKEGVKEGSGRRRLGRQAPLAE